MNAFENTDIHNGCNKKASLKKVSTNGCLMYSLVQLYNYNEFKKNISLECVSKSFFNEAFLEHLYSQWMQ